jgi:hypothetical protein
MSAIKLYTSKSDALYFKDSQRNKFYEFGGIQLLPSGEYSQKFNYSTASFTSAGAYKVSDDSFKANMLPSISIITSVLGGTKFLYFDGLPDLGNDLIYLKIGYGTSSFYYSNPFYITALDEDKTTRFAYYDSYNEYITEGSSDQSIQLKVWFRQNSRQSELTSYYETKTKNTVTHPLKSNNLEMYESEFMSMEDLITVTDILESPYLFVNDEQRNLFEAVKLPELTQQENFGKIRFTLNY